VQPVGLAGETAFAVAGARRDTCFSKKSYRSAYRYPWQAEVSDPVQVLGWQELSDFDLLLRLVDFSGLRPVLAHLLDGNPAGAGSHSIRFPSSCWWPGRLSIAGRAAKPSKTWSMSAMPDYARWVGFQNGVYPSEGGVRHFLTTLGRHSQASGKTVGVEQGESVVEVLVQRLNCCCRGGGGDAAGAAAQPPGLGRGPAVPGWPDPRCGFAGAPVSHQ